MYQILVTSPGENTLTEEIWYSNEHERSCCFVGKLISIRIYCVCELVVWFHDFEEQKTG